MYADDICPKFNKLCPACAKTYPAEMAVCLKDCNMLVTLNWEYDQDELESWLMRSRFFATSHCLRCHRHFSGTMLPTCPEDGGPIERCIDAEIDGPILEGRYQLKSFVGKGRLARVYCTYDLETGGPKTAKFLRPDLCEDEQTSQRYLNLGAQAMLLEHPNIARTYAAGLTANNTPYVVTQYLSGHSLAEELVKRGRIDALTAVKVFVDLLKGLEYAHGSGFMHTNITPSNIFIIQNNDQYSGVLVDFGAAERIFRALDWDESQMKGTRSDVYGNPNALCPEFSAGKKPTPASDIYQLGCCLYEALNGRPPFSRLGTMSTVMAHVKNQPDDFEVRAGLSETLKLVVLECLKKDPNDRFQSAGEMKAVLEEVLQELKNELQPQRASAP